MENDKVSIIIPTFNRFEYLMNTIKSVKEQTYKNKEIIVVNDCSNQKEYYEYDWSGNGVIIIHLEKNSKSIFGFACPGGYQRNFGMEIATGKYIAFCDDDDSWFPNKLTLQVNAMKETGCKMSSTDGCVGRGPYVPTKTYKKYNAEFFWKRLQSKFKKKNKSELIENGFPRIWDKNFINTHNCMICSSVMIEKDIIDKTGKFCVKNYADDYEYWLRIINHTDSVYVDNVCVYYDIGHAGGRKY